MDKYIDKNEILSRELLKKGKFSKYLFNNYFSSDNYYNYISKFDIINDKQDDALRILFNDSSDLLTRCDLALEKNRTCFEAYYILNYFSDSLSFYYQTLDVINTPIENYYNHYERNDVINIKILLSYYYGDILSYHKSLKCIEEVEKYINSDYLLTRKIFIYNMLEDDQSIYKLYNNVSFNEPMQYIIFLVCLLKVDNFELAHLVYDDMLSKYKYAYYIHKPQELSKIKNTDADIMVNAMESCFDIIESVPYFFSWISEHLDSKNELIN